MNKDLRNQIIELARQYHNEQASEAFVAGETYIPPSGKFDEDSGTLIYSALDKVTKELLA